MHSAYCPECSVSLFSLWDVGSKRFEGKRRIHCEVLSVQRLLTTTVSSLTVFKELLCRIGQEKNGIPHIPKIAEKKNNRYSIPDMPGDVEQMFPREKGNKKMKANTVSGGRNRIRKILDKTRFSILPPKLFRFVRLYCQKVMVPY